MSSISKTENVNTKNNSKFKNICQDTASVLGSYAAFGTAKVIFGIMHTKSELKKIEMLGNKKLERMTPEFVENIFNNSELPKRGISLVNTAVNPSNLKNLMTSLTTTVSEIQNESLKQQVEDGLNAYYNPIKKNIIIDSSKIDTALFHEMGHGLNYTGKGFGRLLTKCRTCGPKLLPLVLAIAALRKPKDKKEESTTMIGKTLDFIKDNTVLFATATQAPLLLEEGLASIKGDFIAKKWLNSKELKAVRINNIKGWTSYAAIAGISILATGIANFVRNKTCRDTSTQT